MSEIVFENKPNLIMAHFSKPELEKFDEMQGGKRTVPIQTDYGNVSEMREYSALLEVFADPETRAALEAATGDIKKKPTLAGKLANMSGDTDNMFEPTTSDEEPEIQALEAEGLPHDDEVALIPEGLADYFDDLMGSTQVNPNTGLRQYFKLKNILKPIARFGLPILGAVAGSAFGAPHIGAKLGATLGGALGGGLGQKLTGGNPLMGAALGGLGAFAAPHIAQGFSGMFPSAAAGIGNMFGSTFGSGAANAAGNWLGAGAGQAAAQGAAQALPQAAAQALPQAAAQAAGGTFASEIMKPGNLLPLAGIAGLLYKGHKDSQKRFKQAKEESRVNIAQLRTSTGMSSPLRYVKPYNPGYNPRYNSDYSSEHNYFLNTPGNYSYYKKGGHVTPKGVANIPELYLSHKPHLIDGPGTGQSDNVPATIPAGAYILDASSTSALGDGSSEAGHNIFTKFLSEIRDKAGKKGAHIEAHINRDIYQGSPVKAALSKDEVYVPPAFVSMLGQGDNKRGATLLDKWRKNLRRHKARGGLALPPAAKSPWNYMPKGFRLGSAV